MSSSPIRPWFGARLVGLNPVAKSVETAGAWGQPFDIAPRTTSIPATTPLPRLATQRRISGRYSAPERTSQSRRLCSTLRGRGVLGGVGVRLCFCSTLRGRGVVPGQVLVDPASAWAGPAAWRTRCQALTELDALGRADESGNDLRGERDQRQPTARVGRSADQEQAGDGSAVGRSEEGGPGAVGGGAIDGAARRAG